MSRWLKWAMAFALIDMIFLVSVRIDTDLLNMMMSKGGAVTLILLHLFLLFVAIWTYREIFWSRVLGQHNIDCNGGWHGRLPGSFRSRADGEPPPSKEA